MPGLLDSTRNRITLAVVGVAVVVAGVGAAAVSGVFGSSTTTTTTTTVRSTTTTIPPPVAPLTGLPGVQERLDRTALVVKIDNVEPNARPQVGVNQADVVYEEKVEGSVTRWLAVFHSTDAGPVGPVRSARTSDLGVLLELHRPYFAWSGANDFFAARIRAANLADVGFDRATSHYYRASDRRAPDNLMLKSTADLMALPNEGSGPPDPMFSYRPKGQSPAHLEAVEGVHLSFGSGGGAAPVEYRWNGEGWARSQSGTPHVDADGVRIAPANVIVRFTRYVSSGVPDQFGKMIPEAEFVGEGDAWVFTNGGVVIGRWQKTSMSAATTYTDVDGNPIGLTPGRTWVAVPPPGGATRL
ncbi:MAG: DUF3048 domain-containing protein [Acidimicrobiales bacterium]